MEEGELETVYPDDLEGFALPEMGVHLRAEGQKLLFTELETGQVLGDMEAERNARLQAEAEITRLKALLEANTMGGSGKS